VSVEQDFDIATKLGVIPPCYVRGVKNVTCCGDPDKDSPERREALILENVFTEENDTLSFFYVQGYPDLVRAAVALNRVRDANHAIDLYLVGITIEELANTAKIQTPDQFVCIWAKSNHWNVEVAGQKQEIAKRVAATNRKPKSFNRKRTKEAQDLMRQHLCLSVGPHKDPCVCQTPVPAAPQSGSQHG
jgi:hypothetical protein